tara:strand:- start:394 stop:1191 length:798 start_codon:yes stop_codon:yes gene_type:complete
MLNDAGSNIQYSCALITGATSGIGESFAKLLPTSTNLILTGRNEQKLAELSGQLSDKCRTVQTIAADLATASGRSKLISKIKTSPIDLLINNAGLGSYGAFSETPLEREREMLDVNITAVLELSHALLPKMISYAQKNHGRAGMIVVSSTASVMPIPYLSTYAATKAFERHWGEAIAEEMRKEPIDILVLCPGATRTQFFERAGFFGSMPMSIEEPNAVVKKALDSLGKRTILISNSMVRLALAPTALPRRLFARGIGQFFRRQR